MNNEHTCDDGRAGALIAAEIDRLLRAEAAQKAEAEK